MDYTGLAIAVAIVVYGVLAYRHRERVYWETVTYLRRGERPPERTARMEVWRLETTGAIGLAALVVVVILANAGFHHGGRLNAAIASVALAFSGLFVLLSWMFLRDLKKYRESKRSGPGVRQ
jgi:hypothetical protein